ncbi:glycine betaine ABC transporter substrate-binding protein [Pseudonocardia charpentierae]|uniref:Glycine betaine ABC transporter substrate-binding protein n=1 Tax=Pseudonocardia charpentierae TaxID=3075545 RepID=A0ABU2N8D6_9PSEU|nr:glycine betaine ABC transporter substrate-binding protein [Pseudonocardia sp. DSM 45834]MDT0349753.1 glycine betaine ABC transporter substrate-binding protein [Pseudonocardia sp. DSM 45834]
MTRSPRRRGTSLLAGLIALVIASITACSGQSSSFGGNSGGSSGSGGGAGDKNVSISVVAGWDEDVAASNLWKALLEERGYTVNMQELDIASTFTGVANGQVDLYMDAWLPTTHQAYWDRFKDQLEVVTTWLESKNTIVVPDYVTDVNTVADLKGKAAMFDGRIVGIEAGAGEMKAMREKVIPGYGLGDEYNLVEGSSPAMLASLDSAIKQKQPIVVTLWQPHWAFSRFPIKVLDDTQTAFGPPDQMQILATKGWGEANPEVAGWLKNFTITPEQLSDLMLKIQNGGKGQEQATATQWAADNKQVVDAWFTGTTP